MMDSFGLQFHHLGLACRQKGRAEDFLGGLGYSVGKWVYDPLQDVQLCWCRSVNMPSVEIVVPVSMPGPLDNILKNVDAMTYHICYETTDLEASLDSIKAGGHRVICVSNSKPAVLFEGRNVSFYRIRGVGLIELLERG